MTPIYHDNVSQFRYIAVCRAQMAPGGGVPKMLSPSTTEAQAKKGQLAAPHFGAHGGGWGQLELPKLTPKWGTRWPKNRSKNDTTHNVESEAVFSVRYG